MSHVRRLRNKQCLQDGSGPCRAVSGGEWSNAHCCSQVKVLYTALKNLIRVAAGQYEVTLEHLKEYTGCEASVKTIRRRLHELGVYWRPLREKPPLSAQDKRDRLAFAEKYVGKPTSFWVNHVHITIDNKYYKVLLSHDARHRAAGEGVRAAYRGFRDGAGLEQQYLRPRRDLR